MGWRLLYATFEDTWADVEKEVSKGDIFLVEAYVAMDELAAVQQHQARLQDEPQRQHLK